MNAIRSFLYNGCFLIGTALFLLVSAPTLLTTTNLALAWVGWWARAQARLLKIVVGLDHEVRGAENVCDEPVIYACKHQSAWDTFFFFLLFDRPAYVLKKELLKIPIWGQYARKCRAIAVDRDGGASALKSLVKDTKDRLAAGRPVIIFPEGTRTAPGHRLPYNPGIAALYAQCGVPVVPVALNSGLFWGRRSYRKYPGTITVDILPAIAPGMKRRDFMALLESRIEDRAMALLTEARDRFPKLPGGAVGIDVEAAGDAPQTVDEPVDKSDAPS